MQLTEERTPLQALDIRPPKDHISESMAIDCKAQRTDQLEDDHDPKEDLPRLKCDDLPIIAKPSSDEIHG